MKKNGFTLVEMLVSLIISSILILMVGVLSEIANGTYNKVKKEQEIYGDISYGIKLLQFKMRNSSSIAPGSQPAPWISGQHFLIGSGIFGLYQTSGTVVDLVYDNGVNRETIFSVPQPGIIAVTIIDSATLNPITTATKSIDLTISGEIDVKTAIAKTNRIKFNMQTTILRRN